MRIARGVIKCALELADLIPADLAPMGTQRPKTSEEEHVVLQFRPRRPARLPGQRPSANTANAGSPNQANHPPRHQPARDQPDDFLHRMLANAAAFAFTVALIAVGLWLAMSIADLPTP
ncbi:hypothetical protein V4R08_06340 [Nitrobacter sp. NHB1]|uniref:hypothetical protein n=1 Tax=Nitrobacter sp. NHB1 TaxID=3119830 RepID=UPI002FFF11D7